MVEPAQNCRSSTTDNYVRMHTGIPLMILQRSPKKKQNTSKKNEGFLQKTIKHPTNAMCEN